MDRNNVIWYAARTVFFTSGLRRPLSRSRAVIKAPTTGRVASLFMFIPAARFSSGFQACESRFVTFLVQSLIYVKNCVVPLKLAVSDNIKNAT